MLQISLNEKIPRHSQLFSWETKINLKENWDAKVCIFCSLTAAPAVFVYILQAKSLASASGTSWINHLSFKTDSRLKYRAICCSINQLVLDNISGQCRLLNSIFGKPHKRQLPYWSTPLSSTRLGDNSLISEERRLLFVFPKEPIQSLPC